MNYLLKTQIDSLPEIKFNKNIKKTSTLITQITLYPSLYHLNFCTVLQTLGEDAKIFSKVLLKLKSKNWQKNGKKKSILKADGNQERPALINLISFLQ